MRPLTQRIVVSALTSALWLSARLTEARTQDRGASTVETVVIAAGLAALAISVVAAIKILVDGKVGGMSL